MNKLYLLMDYKHILIYESEKIINKKDILEILNNCRLYKNIKVKNRLFEINVTNKTDNIYYENIFQVMNDSILD